MDNTLAAIKAQLDMHSRWFNNVLADISDQESLHRHSDQLNHIKWVAGHLLNTRLTSMSRIAGLQTDGAYTALFARGAALAEPASYPSLDEILHRWNEAAAGIANALQHLPQQVLMSKLPAQVPIADDTVMGMLLFLISHEAFHIGQLSMLRRLAGKNAMSYG